MVELRRVAVDAAVRTPKDRSRSWSLSALVSISLGLAASCGGSVLRDDDSATDGADPTGGAGAMTAAETAGASGEAGATSDGGQLSAAAAVLQAWANNTRCARALRCDNQTLQTCLSLNSSEDDWRYFGGVSYYEQQARHYRLADLDAQAACLKVLKAAPCSQGTPDVPECSAVLIPIDPVAAGDPCAQNQGWALPRPCQAGYYCAGDGDCGTCTPLAPDGSVCMLGRECTSDFCDAISGRCGPGFYVSATGGGLNDGETCGRGTMYCANWCIFSTPDAATGVCGTPQPTDADTPCSAFTSASELSCPADHYSDPPASGPGFPARCVCHPRLANDQLCSDDDQCLSSKCAQSGDGHRCAKSDGIYAACATDADCASGFCQPDIMQCYDASDRCAN